MSTITFDTLKYANTLKAGGVPPAQAEAEAVALSEVLDVNLKELVTKSDLEAAMLPVRRDIELLRHDMDARFIQLEQHLTIKLGVLMAASVSIVVALVKLL